MSAIGGPFFEDLEIGVRDETAPGVTLTSGLAAVHQAILGDRLRLALDAPLAYAVTGVDGPLAHPALVWDVAIGQSTTVTQRVVANLFYRGLVFRRAPIIGDTLRTSTEIVALRQTTPREGRPAVGLAVLRIRTVDQEERAVLDFWRCAMLPLRDPVGRSGRDDSFDGISEQLDRSLLVAAIDGWSLDRFARVDGSSFTGLQAGDRWSSGAGDVASSAPELARLTVNIAAVHHDRHLQTLDRRLVYGGHTIGLALAQAARSLPNLVTVVGWHSCDHLAPVYEGDTLRSEVEVEQVEPLSGGGGLVDLRSRVRVRRGDEDTAVLDWRFVALVV